MGKLNLLKSDIFIFFSLTALTVFGISFTFAFGVIFYLVFLLIQKKFFIFGCVL